MPHNQPQLQASAQVLPNRFIKTTGPRLGAQCGNNERPIGVSGQSTKYPPLSDLVTTNPHADLGEPITVFGDGDIVAIEAGAAINPATVSQVKSDANGRAVPVATTGTDAQNAGAIPLEVAAAAGELILCQVQIDTSRPAVS